MAFKKERGFPGGPVAESMLPVQGAWGQSLAAKSSDAATKMWRSQINFLF